ncbi:MAG: AAA family ATPase [Terriglobales bacterium]
MTLHVSLGNYGPFEDSGEIALEPGLNVIAGLNNTGKTALLLALFALRSGPLPPDASWNDGGQLRTHVGGYARPEEQTRVRLRWDPDDAECERVRRRAEAAWGHTPLPAPSSLEVAATWLGGSESGLWLQALLFRAPDGTPTLICGSDPAQPRLVPLAGAAAPPNLLEKLGLGPSPRGGAGPFRAASAELSDLPWPRITLGAHILAAARRLPDYNSNVAIAHTLAPEASNLAAVLQSLCRRGTPPAPRPPPAAGRPYRSLGAADTLRRPPCEPRPVGWRGS